MRPSEPEHDQNLYECFECGERTREAVTRRCVECGGQLKHIGRARDL